MTINTNYPWHKDLVQHQGSVGSNGIQTTSQADEETTFENVVNSLEIIAEGADLNITLVIREVAETVTHLIKANEGRLFEGYQITGFKIAENGASYSYSGGYY